MYEILNWDERFCNKSPISCLEIFSSRRFDSLQSGLIKTRQWRNNNLLFTKKFQKFRFFVSKISHFVPRGNFHEGNPGRYILVFCHPISQNVLGRWPREVPHSVDFDTFPVQKAKWWCFINAQSGFVLTILSHPGEELVVGRPFENWPRSHTGHAEWTFFHSSSSFPNNYWSNFFGQSEIFLKKKTWWIYVLQHWSQFYL